MRRGWLEPPLLLPPAPVLTADPRWCPQPRAHTLLSVLPVIGGLDMSVALRQPGSGAPQLEENIQSHSWYLIVPGLSTQLVDHPK